MNTNNKVQEFIENNLNKQKQALIAELGISRIYENEDTEENQTYPYYDSDRTLHYRCEEMDISDEEYTKLLAIQRNMGNKTAYTHKNHSGFYGWGIAFIIITILAVLFLCKTYPDNVLLWLGIGINDIFMVGLPLIVLSKIEENTRLK